MNSNSTCPECGSENLHFTVTKSGGPYGPLFLPGLGSFLTPAQFRVILCGDCGLTRFFAEPSSLAKLNKSRAWRRVELEMPV
jgi:predicted nucleic-acid-binding Zn-ribbon protein